MTEQEIKETGRCSICWGQYVRWGNNPEPVMDYPARCCDSCNRQVVIPTRLKLLAQEISRKGGQR